MQNRFGLRVGIALLLISLLVRAAVGSVMPIQMMVLPASGSSTSQGMVIDCPGHADMAAESSGTSSDAGIQCTFCGECCVVAPVFLAFARNVIDQSLRHSTLNFYALPALTYLTPVSERPPAA